MREALAELIPSRATTQIPQAALPSVSPIFACPFSSTGINLYALAFDAARLSVQRDHHRAFVRRFSATVN